MIESEIVSTDIELRINKWHIRWRIGEKRGTFTTVLDSSCDENEVEKYFKRRAKTEARF